MKGEFPNVIKETCHEVFIFCNFYNSLLTKVMKIKPLFSVLFRSKEIHLSKYVFEIVKALNIFFLIIFFLKVFLLNISFWTFVGISELFFILNCLTSSILKVFVKKKCFL